MIGAAKKLNLAVGQIPNPISGLIQARRCVVERVCNKSLSCQLRLIVVATANLNTTQIQFTGYAYGDELSVTVQYVGLSIAHRTADRNSPVEVAARD